MNVIFVHDHVFVEYDGMYYSEGKITQKTWERFSPSPENQILVIARSKKASCKEDIARLTLSSSDCVSFSCFSSYGEFFKLSELFNLVEILKVSSCRILRLPSFLGLLIGFLCIFLRKNYGCEVVGHARESLMHSSSLVSKFIALPFSQLTKFLISRAKISVYVTASYLQRDYPSRGENFSASNVELPVMISSPKIRSASMKSVPVRLGFVGSLNNKYKGLDFLLAALPSLEFEFELEIVGTGSLQPFYEELSSGRSNVKFVGSLKGGEEMINWMSRLDVYIHPSLTEGLPRALIEAMSLGLPCVATSVGGIPELLPCEYLVPPSDSDAIAAALNRLVSSEDEIQLASSLNLARSNFYRRERLDFVRKKAWASYIKV